MTKSFGDSAILKSNKNTKASHNPEDNYTELINLLNNFFSNSAKKIYEKVNKLGSCPIIYKDSQSFNKEIYQHICELALKDFITLIKAEDNSLYSVSINFKTKNDKEDVYTLCCAFAASQNAEKIRISPLGQAESIYDHYKSCPAKTKFDDKEYKFINESQDDKNKPHHGISFGERFIEKIDFDNMWGEEISEVDKGDAIHYTHNIEDKKYIYKISKKDKNGNDIKLDHNEKYDLDNDKPYILFNDKKGLALLFDDGSNKDNIGNPTYTYPDPNRPIQHRNQAAFFPIECKSGDIVKRIGYIQLTAYYSTRNKVTSYITKEDIIDDKIVKKFMFYSNLVLLANKISNIAKTNIEKRSDITYLVSIGKDNNIKAEPLSNRCLINYEEN